jgi:predicted AAA+ superfamily ATPase
MVSEMVDMKPITRFYDAVLDDHLGPYRQMAWVSGPRQVGKTTTCHKE